jgi:DNA (cytosine-5)-methyltransferase 1
MCHPTELRALTLGECAAIQEFPSSWTLAGTTPEKYRQVGNAVPVRLGIVAGKCIEDLLVRISKVENKTVVSQKIKPSTIRHLRPHVRTRRYWHKGKALAGDFGYYEDDDENGQGELFAVDN